MEFTSQLHSVPDSRGAKGWLGTCRELSFILLVAPEGCVAAPCVQVEKKSRWSLVLLLGREQLRCQGSVSNGWILVEVILLFQ